MAPDKDAGSGDKPPFSRIIIADDAGPAREGHIEATPVERVRLASLFRVEDVASLAFDYRLDALPSRRYRLTGQVTGTLTQLCSVTLEPVVEHIREDVSLEYWPAHLLQGADEDRTEAQDPLDSDPPEPLIDGKIDLGQLAAEIFASAINPYPRKEGADFAWQAPKAQAGGDAAHPFAGLAKLKPKN